MEPIIIHSSWKVAGRSFGWGSIYSWEGISISNIAFDVSPEIMTVILNEPKRQWTFEKQKAIDFIKKYQSIVEVKGKRLGVLPLKFLDEISQK